MRPALLEPQGGLEGDTGLSIVLDVLGLVGVKADYEWSARGTLAVRDGVGLRWTPLERLLAYDWAMREYLHASDNPIRRRPKPSFIPELP